MAHCLQNCGETLDSASFLASRSFWCEVGSSSPSLTLRARKRNFARHANVLWETLNVGLSTLNAEGSMNVEHLAQNRLDRFTDDQLMGPPLLIVQRCVAGNPQQMIDRGSHVGWIIRRTLRIRAEPIGLAVNDSAL
jgi:hypothetical protein